VCGSLEEPKAMASSNENQIINPFESAFAIMKDLRTEVQQLRAALKTETEKRESEVTELKGEVKYLREELLKEQAERQVVTQKISTAQAGEIVQIKAEIEKIKANKISEIAKLTGSLEDEAKRALHAQQDLLARFEAETLQRKADNEAFTRDLADQKARTETWQSESTTWTRNIKEDLKRIVGQLNHVDKAWQEFKYDSLSCIESKIQKQTAD